MNEHIKISRILIIVAGLIGLIHSQPANFISGNVIDIAGQPVVGAYITIRSDNSYNISDETGSFSIRILSTGKIDLLISHIGFEDLQIEGISVNENSSLSLGTIQLKPNIFETDATVITATRSEIPLYEVPIPMNVVDQRMIIKRSAKTSAEALREETGVYVQKTSHGGGSAIVRGMSSNQILLLIDGIRLNNSTYRLGNHQYLTTVDQNSLSKIEVVRGPTSVLYGSDALGGTINLVTQNPFDSELPIGWNFSGFGRFASADNEQTFYNRLHYRGISLALHFSFAYKDYQDLRRGGNSGQTKLEKSTTGLHQSPSGFNGRDFDSKLFYMINAKHNIILSYQHANRSDVPRYDKYENDAYFQWYYAPQNRHLAYMKHEMVTSSSLIQKIETTLSYNLQEEGRRTQQSIDSDINQELDKVQTFGLNLKLKSKIGDHQLISGVELYFDHINSQRSRMEANNSIKLVEPRGRYPDDSKYYSSGIYVRDEFNISNRLKLGAGLRYSFFRTRFELDDQSNSERIFDENFQAITTSLNSQFLISEKFRINLNIGQGFRAPNLSDFAKFGESKGQTFEIPNPGLNPEQLISIDLGLDFRNDWLLASLNAYYNSIWNLIGSDDDLYKGQPTIAIDDKIYKIKSKQNTGKAFITGFESAVKISINNNWILDGNLTTTYGQNTSLNEPVNTIPPTFGRLALNYQSQYYNASIFVRFAANQDRLSSDDLDDPRIPLNETPAWYTLNLRGSIQIIEQIRLQAALENIFDVNYREHGSGINGPGRNLILQLMYAVN